MILIELTAKADFFASLGSVQVNPEHICYMLPESHYTSISFVSGATLNVKETIPQIQEKILQALIYDDIKTRKGN